jgi:hypothetical protein
MLPIPRIFSVVYTSNHSTSKAAKKWDEVEMKEKAVIILNLRG